MEATSTTRVTTSRPNLFNEEEKGEGGTLVARLTNTSLNFWIDIEEKDKGNKFYFEYIIKINHTKHICKFKKSTNKTTIIF